MAEKIEVGVEFLANVSSFKSALAEIEKGLRNTGSAGKKSVDPLSASFNELGMSALKGAAGIGAVYLSVKTLSGFMQNSIAMATQYQNSLIGVATVAKRTGVDASELTAAIQTLTKDGLMTMRDAAESLKNLMAKGMNLDQASRSLAVFRDFAAFGRQGSLSFGDAVRGTTEGLKNNMSQMSDNGGMTKNLSNIYKDAGLSAKGLTGGLLDFADAQKLVIQLEKEGNLVRGDAKTLLTTYAGSVSAAGKAWNDFSAEIGTALQRMISSSGIMDGFTSIVGKLAKMQKDFNLGSIFEEKKWGDVPAEYKNNELKFFQERNELMYETLDIYRKLRQRKIDFNKATFGNQWDEFKDARYDSDIRDIDKEIARINKVKAAEEELIWSKGLQLDAEQKKTIELRKQADELEKQKLAQTQLTEQAMKEMIARGKTMADAREKAMENAIKSNSWAYGIIDEQVIEPRRRAGEGGLRFTGDEAFKQGMGSLEYKEYEVEGGKVVEYNGKVVFIQDVKSFKEYLTETEKLEKEASERSKQIAEEKAQEMTNIFQTFSATASQSLFNAFNGKFNGISKAFKQMAQRMAADFITSGLFSMLSMGAGGNAFGLFKSVGKAFGFLAGGAENIQGGVPNTDSIPVMMMAGETVLVKELEARRQREGLWLPAGRGAVARMNREASGRKSTGVSFAGGVESFSPSGGAGAPMFIYPEFTLNIDGQDIAFSLVKKNGGFDKVKRVRGSNKVYD